MEEDDALAFGQRENLTLRCIYYIFLKQLLRTLLLYHGLMLASSVSNKKSRSFLRLNRPFHELLTGYFQHYVLKITINRLLL